MFDGSSQSDRYIYEEGDHATEMYFIMSGHWAVGYNLFADGIRTLKERLKIMKQVQMDKAYPVKGVTKENSKAREAAKLEMPDIKDLDMKENISKQLEDLNSIRESGLIVAQDFII